jgi:hypothetical protein
MLLPHEAAKPELFTPMLKGLSQRPPPSKRGRSFALDGLPNIRSAVENWIRHRPPQRLAVIEARH